MTTTLVLEDEPLIAMDTETTLRQTGFGVSILGSCAEASEWLGVRRPDVVIVDIMLRDEPSGAVVEHIIANGIPFVVHSGDVAASLVGLPCEHGTWLGKPSGPDDLLAAFKQATSAQRQP